jgi:hypothetical protein
MVIAAAADRAGGRISRLVHLDSYVPRDGESCWSSTSELYRQAFVAGAAGIGYAVGPPDGLDPRTRPHPIASLLQAIRLTGAFARVPRREFVYCSGWEDRTPFAELRSPLQSDPEWQVHDLPTGHAAMREAPMPSLRCCSTNASRTHRRQCDALTHDAHATQRTQDRHV